MAKRLRRIVLYHGHHERGREKREHGRRVSCPEDFQTCMHGICALCFRCPDGHPCSCSVCSSRPGLATRGSTRARKG